MLPSFPHLEVDLGRLAAVLVALLRAGRPIILIGRNSTPNSKRAFEYAIDDLYGAAEALAKLGIDLLSALPPRERIRADLRKAQEVRVDRFNGGKRLSHRYVDYDLVATHGVWITVCAGTGKQLDANAQQPWIQRNAETAQRLNAGLIFGKELHRLGRSAWGAGPLMSWVQASGCWLGSDDRGLFELDSANSARLFFDISAAEEQGRKFPIESRRGMRAHTDTEMVNGRARIGVGHRVPAGLAVVSMLNSTGRSRQLMYLDSADYRPTEDEVAKWYPTVVDSRGRPADQVAAVRYLLANLGQPGVRWMDLVAELREQGLSTHHLRQMHLRNDMSIRDSSDPNAIGMLKAIADNLAFYETGTLRFKFGIDDIADIEVHNCEPPGGWATAADFERIRAFRAAAAPPRDRFRYTFAGLRVTTNDVEHVLRSRPRTYDKGNDAPLAVYNLVPVDPKRSRPRVRLTHHDIAQWYVDGIAAAGDAALPLVVGDVIGSPAVAELATRRDERRSELAGQQVAANHLLNRITETDGAASAALERRYNEEVEPQLRALETEVAELEVRLADERQAATAADRPAAAELLLEFIAELRDPTSGRFRDDIVPATRDVTYSRETHKFRDVAIVTHTLTGTLHVGASDLAVEIPLRRRWSDGAGTEIAGRAPAVIEQLKAGVTFGDVDVPLAGLTRPAVAELLGVRSDELLLPRILDGRISRAVTHTIYLPDGRTNEQIAADLAEPVEFIARIKEMYSDPPPRWLRGNARYVAALYASAAHNDGLGRLGDVNDWAGTKRIRLTIAARDENDGLELVWGRGYRVPACSHCGSHQLMPLRIREPSGPVCGDCRRDRIGIEWPADAYDQYLLEPGIWALAAARYT